MKRCPLLSILFLFFLGSGHILAQVGIGTTTPNANAQLDIASQDKGLLIPRVTEEARVAMGAAADGLMVYQTDVVKGFYFRQNGAWVRVGSTGSAIIPYASGGLISLASSGTQGMSGIPVFVGFGAYELGTTALGSTIDITQTSVSMAMSMPRDGVIESISASFTSSAIIASLFGVTTTVNAQLYSAGPDSKIFTEVSGTKITLAPTFTFTYAPIRQVSHGILTGLNIPVAAQTRLLMVYSSFSTESPTTLSGTVSGGISIGGQ